MRVYPLLTFLDSLRRKVQSIRTLEVRAASPAIFGDAVVSRLGVAGLPSGSCRLRFLG